MASRIHFYLFIVFSHFIPIKSLDITPPPSPHSSIFACFTLFENRFLEKSGIVIVDRLPNVTQCLLHCLEAETRHRIRCSSVMWKRDSKDCVLSRHSRRDRPNKFQVAPSLEVDFYENVCESAPDAFVDFEGNYIKSTNEVLPTSEFSRTTVSKVTATTPTIRRRPKQARAREARPNVQQRHFDAPAQQHSTRKIRRQRAKVFATTMTTMTTTTTGVSMASANGDAAAAYLGAYPLHPPPSNAIVISASSQAGSVPLRAALRNAGTPQFNIDGNAQYSNAEGRYTMRQMRKVEAASEPPQTRANRQLLGKAVVFRDAPTYQRNIRGSVILVPEEVVVDKTPDTTQLPIRPGPVTRHFYRSLSSTTTPLPPRVEISHSIDAKPLVLASGGKPTQTQIAVPPAAPIKASKDRQPDAPCFIRYIHKVLLGYEEFTRQNASLRECLLSCLYNDEFYCASVNYDVARKICVINGGNAAVNRVPLIQAKTADYYENTCKPQDPQAHSLVLLPAKDISRCLTIIPNTLLVDLNAGTLSTAETIEQCQTECLRSISRQGRSCAGLNWLPATKGCMIFSPGYERRLFSPSNYGAFYINSCTDETFESSNNTSSDEYYDDFAH